MLEKNIQICAWVEPLLTFTLNASRSYNLLYFIDARKASQMLLRNLRKIYAIVEIHLKAPYYKIRNDLQPPTSTSKNSATTYNHLKNIYNQLQTIEYHLKQAINV